jgi:hypothetical protein
LLICCPGLDEGSDSESGDADADADADADNDVEFHLADVQNRLMGIENDLKSFDKDFDILAGNNNTAFKQLKKMRKEDKARQMYVDARLETITLQLDFIVSALKQTGLAVPSPSPATTPLIVGQTFSNPPVPPIVVTPCTPANTQEAEAYALRPLQPPPLGSLPPTDTAREPVREGISAGMQPEMTGQPPVRNEEPVRVPEVGAVASESAPGNMAQVVAAGNLDEAGQVDQARMVDEAGTVDHARTVDEAGTVDQAKQADEPVTPAAATPVQDIQPVLPAPPLSQPPPPPASQPTLPPPAPLLPSFLSPGSPTHTPASTLPLSPLPGQTSRRSPRLQNPTVPSPTKEKRPRQDDEGRGTSKRRKE